MKRLALDVGEKRIGLALGDPASGLVSELKFIVRGDKEIEELKKIMKERKVEEVIIGYPLGLSGKPTEQTRKVLAFYQDLKKSLKDIPLVLWDERLTTQLALKSLKSQGKKRISRQKSHLDALSAAFILQSYFDYLRNKE